jgi:hypothetical protein
MTTAHRPDDDAAASDALGRGLLQVIGQVPNARVRRSQEPEAEARRLARRAAVRSALTAGSLALPTGPLGWLTVLPELRAVWRVQTQLVADLAALYGKKTQLTQEQVLYCLFRHSSSQVFRELIVRVGDRTLVSRASVHVLKLLARKLGAGLARRAVGKGAARWLPVAGAVGVGAFAYYETSRVADTAIELFSGEIDVVPPAADGA